MGLDGSEIKSCCNQRWDLRTTTNYVVEIFGSLNVEIFGSIKLDLTITPNYFVKIFDSFNIEKSHANSSGTPSA